MTDIRREAGWIKYCDVEYLGSPENDGIWSNSSDEIIIEEKIDGGNGSFMLDPEGQKILMFSRNQPLDPKMFVEQQKWMYNNIINKFYAGELTLNPSFIYYVEWMAKHTIAYDKIKTPPVIGLDIRMKHSMNPELTPAFIEYDAKVKEFERIGIPLIRLIGRHLAKDVKKMGLETIPQSVYYVGVSEGIVLKNYGRQNQWGRQMFGKIVTKEFKEQNKAVFGAIKKSTDDDTSLIADEWGTEARIRKKVLVCTHELGISLSRKLMHQVPEMVCGDIFKEGYQEITTKYKACNFKLLRTIISKRCLGVLDKMMLEKLR